MPTSSRSAPPALIASISSPGWRPRPGVAVMDADELQLGKPRATWRRPCATAPAVAQQDSSAAPAAGEQRRDRSVPLRLAFIRTPAPAAAQRTPVPSPKTRSAPVEQAPEGGIRAARLSVWALTKNSEAGCRLGTAAEPGQRRLEGFVHHLDAEDPDRGGGLRARACRAEQGQERRADPGDVEQQHGAAVDAGTEQDRQHQARKGGRQGGRLDGQGHDRGGERHPERLGHGKADREHAARRGGGQHQRRALRREGCGQGAGEGPDRDQERVEDQARHGRGCEQPDEQVGAVRRGGRHGRNRGP